MFERLNPVFRSAHTSGKDYAHAVFASADLETLMGTLHIGPHHEDDSHADHDHRSQRQLKNSDHDHHEGNTTWEQVPALKHTRIQGAA